MNQDFDEIIKDHECPKCMKPMKEASYEILNSLSVDFGHDLYIGPKKSFYLNPQRRSPVQVVVCTQCGYIETYAVSPQGL